MFKSGENSSKGGWEPALRPPVDGSGLRLLRFSYLTWQLSPWFRRVSLP